VNRRFEITALAYARNGRLLAVGRNSYYKTHPLQAKLAKKASKPLCVYLHAEIDALIKARQPVYKLVVTRFNSKGAPVSAKPCSICQLAIQHFKVKKVEHT